MTNLRLLLVSLATMEALSITPALGEPTAPTEGERLARAVTLLEHPSTGKRQKALGILGRLPGAGAEKILLGQFDRLATGQLPLPLWLDLFEAATAQGTPALQARLAERKEQLAASSDPLLSWRECLEGGDAEAGQTVFAELPQAGCIRCHAVNGQGGAVGPELAGLGQRTDRIYILESILLPNTSVVFGYQHLSLTLKSGEKISGLLNGETRDELTLISTVDGKKSRVKTDDVEVRIALPTVMPPAFGQVLTRRQIRDLVEFLATTEPK